MNHTGPISVDSDSAQRRFGTKRSAIDFAEALDLSVHDSITSIKQDWKQAEQTSNISVYQRYEWVEAYLNTQSEKNDIRPFIIVGRFESEVVFILPFVLKGKFLTRVKFIGDSHVNFNMGIFPSAFKDVLTPNTFRQIFERIQKLTPGLGYLALCCQPERWRGTANPLMCEPHQRSANPAFFLDLSGGFEQTLARGNAKRKRKKFRQQTRQAEAYGGFELFKPETADDVKMLIDVFLLQKSNRLKQLGIRDVFADEQVRVFLTDLAKKSLGKKQPLLQLYGLKLGEEIAAVFGAGSSGEHLSGFFSSIDGDRYAEISPGEMLLYLVVEDACAEGYQQMDLGAGDERYKRSWSTEVVEMYEIFMPYNVLSYPAVLLRRLYGSIRRRIRKNESSWHFYKNLRKLKPKLLKKAV